MFKHFENLYIEMFKYLLHVPTFPEIHVYYPDKQGKEQVRNYQPTFMCNQKHLYYTTPEKERMESYL